MDGTASTASVASIGDARRSQPALFRLVWLPTAVVLRIRGYALRAIATRFRGRRRFTALALGLALTTTEQPRAQEVSWLEAPAALLWALAGVLLGGASTYLASRAQQRFSQRQDDRRRLLDVRTTTFKELWKITKALPRNPHPSELAGLSVERVIRELNDWYFDEGGFFLTDACREAYFSLLEQLAKAQDKRPPDTSTYMSLYGAASALRATLTNEIDARTSVKTSRI